MGSSTEELEREIVAARADLALTIGEIEQRLAPRRLVERNVELAKQNLPVVAGVGAIVVLLLAVKTWRRRH